MCDWAFPLMGKPSGHPPLGNGEALPLMGVDGGVGSGAGSGIGAGDGSGEGSGWAAGLGLGVDGVAVVLGVVFALVVFGAVVCPVLSAVVCPFPTEPHTLKTNTTEHNSIT